MIPGVAGIFRGDKGLSEFSAVIQGCGTFPRLSWDVGTFRCYHRLKEFSAVISGCVNFPS